MNEGREKPSFELLTIDEVYDHLIELATKIKESNAKIDLIVGISRGGLLPARILCDLLSISEIKIVYATLYSGIGERMAEPIVESRVDEADVKGKSVLLVDDVADTGKTLLAVERHLIEKGASRVYKAVLYRKPWCKASVDFYVRETSAWVIFPWAYLEYAYDLIKSGRLEELKSIVSMNELYRDLVKKFLGELLDVAPHEA